MEKTDINGRVIAAINAILNSNKDVNKTTLAASLGVKPAKFSEILNGRMLAGTDIMSNLCVLYDVNAMWLLTGVGGMHITNVEVEAPLLVGENESMKRFFSQFDQFIQKKDAKIIQQEEIIDKLYQEKAIPFSVATKQSIRPIPLVTQSVAAGFGNENFSIAESDVKEYYVIPKFRYCQVDFMIEVSGDSMTPHLNSGDVIACTILRDSRFIQWNRIHVIATREQGLLVKRLAPSSDDGCLQAVSDNPKYPPFSIPKDEISGLALVVGSVCLE